MGLVGRKRQLRKRFAHPEINSRAVETCPSPRGNFERAVSYVLAAPFGGILGQNKETVH